MCFTGRSGQDNALSNATPETLGAVQTAELRSALNVLKAQSMILLGYRDSGMVGTEDNHNPAAFINVPIREAVVRLIRIIGACRTKMITTTDHSGGYGYPRSHPGCRVDYARVQTIRIYSLRLVRIHRIQRNYTITLFRTVR